MPHFTVAIAPESEHPRWLIKMKTGLVIGIVVGFALGLLAYGLLSVRPDSAKHWRAIEKYYEFLKNPSSYTVDAKTGYSMASPPYEIDSHLVALVAAGELEHIDIVLPTVFQSQASTTHWMAFCERHRDIIISASGEPSWVAYKPKGSRLVHLNLWFKPSGEALIQQLISELEGLNSKPDQEPTTSSTLRR